ncbi:MAG TPA: cytochrome b N-terminal domain-containing protein [Gemmatimonadales bacterium]|nr:cytochrome b N-terminal domain-containing protein [Gemmatimonadales bacterium]
MLGNARRAVATWAARFWADLKASTDANLLGVLRFLGLLYGPIDTSLPIDQAFRRALRYRLPRHAGWRHALGGIAYLLLILLVVTGVLLSFYYRPSAEEAYQSVQHIVSGITFGWLMRDLHVWGANLIVLATLAHLGRVFFDASYKPPRETNWLVGVALLFVVFAFGATGYLLPWDQAAYWTVTEALDVVERIPVVGGLVVEVLRGDPIVSGATLSRFFAVHVILLPWAVLGLLMLHFALVRKHGIAPARTPPPDGPGVPFFPQHFLRSFIAGVLVVALVITGAALYPRDVGEPPNPSQVPGTLATSWVVADVSRGLTYYLGAWGFGGFLLLGLAMALLPLFDRDPERRLRRRPAVAALGVVFFLGFIAAWLVGRQLRSVPPHAPAVPGVFVQPPPPSTP